MNNKIILIIVAALSFLACTEEIDMSNRYTFTGETVADYMSNRSEKYSHMIYIFKKAKLFGLLSTWGKYTLFLPDNDAIEKYLVEQDSIYWATKDTGYPVWTGITSPMLDEISDSMANAIARMHLIEYAYRTAMMGEGAIANKNTGNKYLSVSYKVEGDNFYIMIDNHSAIIDGDNDVENGVVHIIDKVINPRRTRVPELIASYNFFSLFNKALIETGYGDSLLETDDSSFIPEEIDENFTAIGNLQIPKTKLIRYTAFIETDDVFRANGIETLDDLKAFAEKWYGKEERNNPRSPRNALYKFVAYHFLGKEVPYNFIVPYGSYYTFNIEETMLPNRDRCDYHETQLGTLFKAVKPLSTTYARDIYINYSKRKAPYNPEMLKHINVRVIPLTEFTQSSKKYSLFNQMSENGIVHPIDKILIYNEDEMAGNILNERIRLDVISLIPEVYNNGLRYTTGYKLPKAYNRVLRINSGMTISLPNPLSYFGDMLDLTNNFDVSIRIPKLPSRTYEVRIGYTTFKSNLNVRVSRRYVQVYFGNKIAGRPFDVLMWGSDATIGWVDDKYTYDNGYENDKAMRNKGWMKAPDVFKVINPEATSEYMSVRSSPRYLRRIVTREYIGGESEYWMRFRDLGGSYLSEPGCDGLYLDYIEFVPLHIINNPAKPEDRY